jgi:hypothetical protein
VIFVSSTNKTDRHDIAEILLKVALKQHSPNPNLTKQVLILKDKHRVPKSGE